MKLKLIIGAVLLLGVLQQAYGYTIVGNGDDGTDLEGLTKITDGPIVQARDKAVELLNKLNVSGIRSLGILIPEVSRSELYLAKEERQATQAPDQGQFHSDMRGFVYARTLAQPHAVTRFFPVAQSLSQDQLVALHIHEGLHRALPAHVREDETVVSQITLALTSPGANRDQVEQAVNKNIPDNDLRNAPIADTGPNGRGAWSAEEVPDGLKYPSDVGYGFRQYWKSNTPSHFHISSLHTVHSDLYPFGGARHPFGIGIEGSLVNSQRGSHTGPLGISARLKLWSKRDFAVGVWAMVSLNTLSAEELQNSPYGRDLVTLGTSLRKNVGIGYVENFISLTTGGSSTQRVGLIDYTHSYGEVITVKVRAGVRFWHLDVGAFTEMALANHYRVSGGTFHFDTGRYRILSGGPEVTYMGDGFALGLQTRFLLNATQGANFDYLGNLMGAGVAQGSIGLTASLFF